MRSLPKPVLYPVAAGSILGILAFAWIKFSALVSFNMQSHVVNRLKANEELRSQIVAEMASDPDGRFRGPQGIKGDKGNDGDEGGIGVPGPGVPPGTVVAFAGGSIPEGWLLCDGREFDEDEVFPRDAGQKLVGDFSALMGAIGHSWGGTAERPQLPDLRGAFIRGSTSASAPGASGGDSSVSISSLGHKLTIEELPPHDHGMKRQLDGYSLGADPTGKSNYPLPSTGSGEHWIAGDGSPHSHQIPEFSTLPPYATVQLLIKH